MSYKKFNERTGKSFRKPTKKQIEATLQYFQYLMEEDDKWYHPNI